MMDGLDALHHVTSGGTTSTASQALIISAAGTDPMLSAALATNGECCLSPTASSATSTMLSAHHHHHHHHQQQQQQQSSAVGAASAFYYDDENFYSPPSTASAVSDYYGSAFNQCNSNRAFVGSPVAYEQRIAYGKTPYSSEQQQQPSNYYARCSLPFADGGARMSSFDKDESAAGFSPGAYSMPLGSPAHGILVPGMPSSSSAFSEEDGTTPRGFIKDGHHFIFPDDGFSICGMAAATSDGRSSLHSYSSPTSSNGTSSALYCSSGDEALFHSSGASSFLEEEEPHSAAILGDEKSLDFDVTLGNGLTSGSGATASTMGSTEVSTARIKYEYDEMTAAVQEGRKPRLFNSASAQLNGIGEGNRTPLITYTNNSNNNNGHLTRTAAPTTSGCGGGTTIIRVVTSYASRNDITTASRLALRVPKLEQFASAADEISAGRRCGASSCLCGVTTGGETGMCTTSGCGSVLLANSSCSPGSSIASTINSVVIKNTVSGAIPPSQQQHVDYPQVQHQPCQIVYKTTTMPGRSSSTMMSQNGCNNGAQYHYSYTDNGLSHPIKVERPLTAVAYSGVSEPIDENDGAGHEPLLDELNTRELAQRISQELKRYSIPQAIFAQRVLCRSQGTLSDLLRNPKPWSKLKSGRETFRRMAKWLQEPEFQRMSALRLAACKRKEESRENGTFSRIASTSPPSVSLTATASGGGGAHPLLVDGGGGGPPSEAGEEMTRQCREASLASSSTTNADERTLAQQSSPAAKKPRLVFTDIQRRTLHAIFKETKRPSRDMQLTISQQLGLDPNTVANFFMNARRRGHDRHAPHPPPSAHSVAAERERDAAVLPLLAAAAAAASATTSTTNALTAAESSSFSRRATTAHHFPSTVSDGRSFGGGDVGGGGSGSSSGVSSCNSSVRGYTIVHHESYALANDRRGDVTPTTAQPDDAASLLSTIRVQQPLPIPHTTTSSSSDR